MISSIVFLLQLLLVTLAQAKDITFQNLTLVDSYTRNQNCTDLSHWFLIDAQLSVGKGTHNDIFFSVPSDFDSFPNVPLNISNSKGKQIASIYEHSNNMFGINFSNEFQQNTTINFNLLTKLSNSSQSDIEVGEQKTYIIRTTTDNVFDSTINFVGKDLTKMTTNGGSFSNNNTAWFIADIPVTFLSDATTFKSIKTGENDYKYNTKLTKLEVVTKVDTLGNPLESVPFTAYKDQSSSDEIEITIDTRISGSGKFVRIHYFTESLDLTPISNAVTLNQANYLKKRDSTESTTTTVYGDNLDDLAASDVIVEEAATTSVPVAQNTGYLATPLYSNNTRSTQSSSSLVAVSSTVEKSAPTSSSVSSEISIALSSNLITTSQKASTRVFAHAAYDYAPAASSSVTSMANNSTMKPSIITSDNVVETFEVITTTNGAVVTEIGSYVPIATLTPKTKTFVDAEFVSSTTVPSSEIVSAVAFSTIPTSSISSVAITSIAQVVAHNSTVKPSIITSNNVIMTYEVLTSTNGAIVTEIGSYVPISTITPKTKVLVDDLARSASFLASSTQLPSNITTIESTTVSSTISVSSVSVAYNSTIKPSIITSNNVIMTYEVLTSTNGAIVTEVGSYVPLSTITPKTKVLVDAVFHTASGYNVTNDYATSTQVLVNSKTLDALLSATTDLIPVKTLSNATIVDSISVEISATAITKTKSQIEAIYTKLVPVKSVSNSTVTISCSTDVSATAITKTKNQIDAVYTQLVPVKAVQNSTTTVSCSTETGAIEVTKTHQAVKTTAESLAAIGTLYNKTTVSVATSVSKTTISPVTDIQTEIVPLSTLITETSSTSSTSTTEREANTFTKTISPVVATTTELVPVITTQATETTVSTSAGLQHNANEDATMQTLISISQYEAGSNKITLGFTSLFISIFAILL